MSERVSDLSVETLQAAGVKTLCSSARSFIEILPSKTALNSRRIARLVDLLVRKLARDPRRKVMRASESAPTGLIVQPE